MNVKQAAKKIRDLEAELGAYSVSICLAIADTVKACDNVTRDVRALADALGKKQSYVDRYRRLAKLTPAERKRAAAECDSFRSLYSFTKRLHPSGRKPATAPATPKAPRPKARKAAGPPSYVGPICGGCASPAPPVAAPVKLSGDEVAALLKTLPPEAWTKDGRLKDESILYKAADKATGPAWEPMTWEAEVALRQHAVMVECELVDLKEDGNARLAELKQENESLRLANIILTAEGREKDERIEELAVRIADLEAQLAARRPRKSPKQALSASP